MQQQAAAKTPPPPADPLGSLINAGAQLLGSFLGGL